MNVSLAPSNADLGFPAAPPDIETTIATMPNGLGDLSIGRFGTDGDVQEGMGPYYVGINMQALALAEERGAWTVVGRYLEGDLFKRLRAAADPATLAELAAAAERLTAARLYEAVHGQGSLLDMNHWFNIKHLSNRPPPPRPPQTDDANAILSSLALLDASTRL